MLLVGMMLQVATPPPERIDLKPATADNACPARARATDAEIVVCGRLNQQRYRLRPVEDSRFEPSGKAEMTVIGGVKASAELEGAELAGGMNSRRMMIRLKAPF